MKDSGLAHVGPIAVARGSLRPLQAGAVGLVALLLVFSAIVVGVMLFADVLLGLNAIGGAA